MHQSIVEKLRESFYTNEEIKKLIAIYEKNIDEAKISPYEAAQNLFNLYLIKK
jgi:hypothetical protein